MATYTETITVHDASRTGFDAERHITVSAETPAHLDGAIALAMHHWRRSNAAKHLPRYPEAADPWPAS